MCGIGGFRRFGKTPILPSMVRSMFHKLERRGNGATGIALQTTNGDTFVLKKDIPPWKFAAEESLDKFLQMHLEDAVIVLLHTRQPTKGDPRNNDNNHPCFNGVTAITHNGQIQNDDELFTSLKVPRIGEVDSDVIRAILDKEGLGKEGIRELRKLRGSAAIAAISAKAPGRLLLARSGSPIVLASTKDMLIWASEKEAIHQALRPWVNRFGVGMQLNRPDVAWVTMNNHSAWVFGAKPDKDGSYLVWHDKFDVNKEYTPPRYDVRGKYQQIRAKWYSDKSPDILICPNRECGRANVIPAFLKDAEPFAMVCEACDSRLGEKEEA